MTPSDVSLKIVAERLEYVESSIETLRGLPAATLDDFLADRRNPLSTESLLRRSIEGLFDTARHLLSAGFGAGRLEYRQVAEECVRRDLIRDRGTGEKFREMAGYRNRLVHHYEDVNAEELYGLIRSHIGDLEAVAGELRAAARRLVADRPRASRSDTSDPETP